mmetsp:Transcript_58782/g.140111  ORF Transcript_58782/g.140111 Transcript_58782/m.140111 type:complete len:232 (+) Transcript_58782:101-796(+)
MSHDVWHVPLYDAPEPEDVPITFLAQFVPYPPGSETAAASSSSGAVADMSLDQLAELESAPSSRDRHAASSSATSSSPSEFKKQGRLSRQKVLEFGVTTVMLHQLRTDLTQEELLEELDASGFGGLYDFVYMPLPGSPDPASWNSRYAFINMINCESTANLVRLWTRNRKLSTPHSRTMQTPGVFFTAAAVQGLEANLDRAMDKILKDEKKKVNRRPVVLPFVSGGLPTPL